MLAMADKAQRAERRSDGLSKERIVEAATAILDADGEAALTFRALAARFSTGPGALYHHVANKDELLSAATNAIVARVMAEVESSGEQPREAIRIILLGVFDAIDDHPWVGTQLSREPWQTAVLRIFEGIGGQLKALGVPKGSRFEAASALVFYLLGLAGQYAAGARLISRETERKAFLTRIAAQWSELPAADFPFVHQMAAELPLHDDRQQFLAGIDLILTGIDVSP